MPTRNSESRFNILPDVEIQRSIFKRDSQHTTTMNFGDLVPIYIDEILPGDTYKVSTSKIVRLQTLLTPVMGNMYLDVYWFFIPNRLVWSHWKEFCGENTESPWVPTTSYSIPQITCPSGGWNVGTIADYMGLPAGRPFAHSVSALPFRCYAAVANEFFRDENLTYPLNIPTGDADATGSNGSDYINDVALGGQPFKVAKFHDRFSSCLPAPQKGVSTPVIDFHTMLNQGFAEVVARSTDISNSSRSGSVKIGEKFARAISSNGSTWTVDSDDYRMYSEKPTTSESKSQYTTTDVHSGQTDRVRYAPSNLWADVGYALSSFDINDLRKAFSIQRILEKNARGGSRYIEILANHFGITSPDARLQRPEYLGGNRVPINVQQVSNTAQTASDYLGDVGALSYTADFNIDFEHSFVEHGYLLCVACCRYDHVYADGIERMWTRYNTYDFYWPILANIGEQPVYQYEIYANNDGSAQSNVFGFQEAWSEYRFKESRVSCEMRPNVSGSLAYWNLSDNYSQAPTLSDAWIREDKSNVDRVLAVSSSVSKQVLADFYFNVTCTRPMPMYSIPGLIDHN